MVLTTAFVILLSAFFMSTNGLFGPAFDAVGVGVGTRSVVVVVLLGIVTAAIAARRPSRPGTWQDVATTILCWVPWLVYLAARTDLDDAYAFLYLGKVVVTQFAVVVCTVIVYRADPGMFDRVFPIAIIAVGTALLIQAVLNPQVFLYASEVERLTVEGADPISLARSLAFAALCVAVLGSVPKAVRVVAVIVFMVAMAPTGSRGPLIGLVFVLVWYFAASRSGTFRRQALLGAAMAAVVVVAGLAIAPLIFDDVAAFLSRGTGASMADESGRPALFLRAWMNFLSSPLFGIGTGQFGREMVMGATSGQRFYPHNIVLEVLACFGLVGLMLFATANRLGRWLVARPGVYHYGFALFAIFAMVSGDLISNSGVIYMAALARLEVSTRSPSHDPARYRRRAPTLVAT